MATKRKRRVKGKSRVDLLTQTKRQFAKGNYRDALKGAKNCYRQEPAPERRQLLEHALMARAQQLCEARLREEARAVLQSLLDLGVTEPAVEAALPDLLVAAGLWDRVARADGGAAGAIDPQVAVAIADQAVLHPDETQTVPADIRREATAIRVAIEALYTADDAAAYQSLKAISRTSPLADWKLFVRGLAGYYRGNRDEMQANWDRLDPSRRAQRIAQLLRQLFDHDSSPVRADGGRDLINRVERLVRDRPVLATLEALQSELADERWEAAARTFAAARPWLRQFDERLADNIAEIFYWEFVNEADFELLDRVRCCMPPPPLDPHWHRARALDAELADEDVWELEHHWRRYANDLAELKVLSPEDRAVAQALVWERMGSRFAEEALEHAEYCDDPDCEVSDQLHKRAVADFRRGIELAPHIGSIAEALALAQKEWGQEDEAAATCRQLVDRIPDHFSGLLLLAKYDLKNGRPLDARRYAQRALKVKPRDQQLKTFLVTLHLAVARHDAREKQVDHGRAALAAAEQLDPRVAGEFRFLACRAVFEYAVGDVAVAEALAMKAQQALSEPTAALLALAVDSIRYGLAPDAHDAYFEHAWHKALKKRCQSETAGAMARLLIEPLSLGTDYPRSGAHIDAVCGYIKRCSRVRWQAEDLRNVCLFLSKVRPLTDPVLKKLVGKGTQRFANVPLFFLLAGRIEMTKGPRLCGRRSARRSFQRVVDLLADSTDLEEVQMVKTAREALMMLEEPRSLRPPPFLNAGLDLDRGAPMPSVEDVRRELTELCETEGIDPEMVLGRLEKMLAEVESEGG